VHRLVLSFVLALGAGGCISKAREAIAPTPDTVGTLSCREIVEQCDAQCGDPLCLHRCTGEGTQEAQGQHAALLDCGQRNGCTDQECMEQSCPTEITACMGELVDVPVEAVPDDGAPGDTPPSW
jgi:hypothetical protein